MKACGNKLKATLRICLLLMNIYACGTKTEVANMKDLDENMMDLRIYQENLGDHIRSGDLKNGEWLLTGMDSILQLLSHKFDEHRKLSEPFSYFYNKRLKEPIQNIQKAITRNDTALARKNYQLLIRKCNGCHIDHDIDKVVNY